MPMFSMRISSISIIKITVTKECTAKSLEELGESLEPKMFIIEMYNTPLPSLHVNLCQFTFEH